MSGPVAADDQVVSAGEVKLPVGAAAIIKRATNDYKMEPAVTQQAAAATEEPPARATQSKQSLLAPLKNVTNGLPKMLSQVQQALPSSGARGDRAIGEPYLNASCTGIGVLPGDTSADPII